MMRIAFLASLLSFAALAEAQDYSADAYATCAACHLPDGAGIPGAFPRIRNRAAAIAALEGGREYLVTVVTYGLMGAIEVDGNTFFGVMAGNTGMSSEALAAALNYVVFELNDNDASNVAPFTASEVEAVQAATTLKSPAGGGELRMKLVAEHGDEWP
jgi:mono/diheme cytochrome c family protein